MITDHPFVGRREWGIDAPADKPCQAEGCGQARNQHVRLCTAALNIAGQHYPCDLVAPHDGWAHSNKAAQAIWEAR